MKIGSLPVESVEHSDTENIDDINDGRWERMNRNGVELIRHPKHTTGWEGGEVGDDEDPSPEQ